MFSLACYEGYKILALCSKAEACVVEAMAMARTTGIPLSLW